MSGIRLTSYIDTTSELDVYPTHLAKLGKGGYRTVSTITDRNNIPVERREAFMKVAVIATGIIYTLASDLTTWNADTFGSGDMLKSVYDSDNDGKVNSAVNADLATNATNAINSQTLLTKTLAYILSRTNHTDTQAISTISGLQAALDAKINSSIINAVNGICGLDSSGKVAIAQLPFSGLTPKGIWNPSTNSPTLANGSGTLGWFYIANSGTNVSIDLGSDPQTISSGDWLVYNGSQWKKVNNTDLVASVNGQIGAVNLTTANINDSVNRRYVTDVILAALSNALGTPSAGNPFVLQSSLSSLTLVAANITNTPYNGISSTTVQNAINELKLLIDSIVNNTGNTLYTEFFASSTVPITVKTVGIKTSGITVTLPLAVSYPAGQILTIKDLTSQASINPILFTTTSSEIISPTGAYTGVLINTDLGYTSLFSDGARWWIL